MQVAYLLYDRFTALDITGPHEVLNSAAGLLDDVPAAFEAQGQPGPADKG